MGVGASLLPFLPLSPSAGGGARGGRGFAAIRSHLHPSLPWEAKGPRAGEGTLLSSLAPFFFRTWGNKHYSNLKLETYNTYCKGAEVQSRALVPET